MMIEDFGARVASVWAGMQPHTRRMVESALQLTPASAGNTNRSVTGTMTGTVATAPYDSRAEKELSILLSALDERVSEAEHKPATLSTEQIRELKRTADACAIVLQNQAQSAEAFAQLIERSIKTRAFSQIDALADTIQARLAPSEICELTRHTNPAVRALAQEALALSSTATLVELLSDQVDSDAARSALERQAKEYGSDEARWIVNALDRTDADEDEDE